MKKLMKPIVFFDLETTGTSTTQDRIVQLAAQKVYADSSREELKKLLINPLMKIPEGATAIHGITNDMVAGLPTFASHAKNLHVFMQGCNYGGYNVRKFDIPLLAEEFARCGYEYPEKEAKYFDGYNIFANEERRDLASAYKFYTGDVLDGAHDAGVDITATIAIFEAQLKRYPHLAEMDEDELHLYCAGGVKAVDIAGCIVLNEAYVPVYNFGKAKGAAVEVERGFGEWMLKNDFPTNTKNVLRAILYKTKNLPGVQYSIF